MGLRGLKGYRALTPLGGKQQVGRSGSLHRENWVVTVHQPYKTGGFALHPRRHTLHFQDCNAPG